MNFDFCVEAVLSRLWDLQSRLSQDAEEWPRGVICELTVDSANRTVYCRAEYELELTDQTVMRSYYKHPMLGGNDRRPKGDAFGKRFQLSERGTMCREEKETSQPKREDSGDEAWETSFFNDWAGPVYKIPSILSPCWGGGGVIPCNSWWGCARRPTLQILTLDHISDQYTR